MCVCLLFALKINIKKGWGHVKRFFENLLAEREKTERKQKLAMIKPILNCFYSPEVILNAISNPEKFLVLIALYQYWSSVADRPGVLFALTNFVPRIAETEKILSVVNLPNSTFLTRAKFVLATMNEGELHSNLTEALKLAAVYTQNPKDAAYMICKMNVYVLSTSYLLTSIIELFSPKVSNYIFGALLLAQAVALVKSLADHVVNFEQPTPARVQRR